MQRKPAALLRRLEWMEERVVPATFVVNSLADSGANTLRAAITAANAAPGTDTIDASALSGTISLLTALPTITGSTNIVGSGAGTLTVRRDPGAAANFRIFTVDDGNLSNLLSTTITGLTISGGVADRGGGISCRYDSLTINGCVISNNSATGHGGGLDVLGFPSPPVLPTITITNSTISGNTAGDHGGGSYVGEDGFFEIVNSTVSGNTTTGTADGAGLYFWGDNAPVNRWVVRNTTISGNSAAGDGGGIGMLGPNNRLFVQNSTIVGNTAAGFGGGIASVSTGDVLTLESSIVSDNISNNGIPDISTPGSGTFQNSAIGDLFGAANLVDMGGNIIGQNLLLGQLTNNGGPTQTILPGPGSPVINTGSNAVVLGVDQRGNTRTVGQVDIGAVETGSNGVPAANVGFIPEIVTTYGATVYQLRVTYTDDTAINLGTIGAGDITISGPGVVTVGAGTVTGGNGSTNVVVTYPITPPGGSWTVDDNGTYTVSSVAGAVTDTGGTPITGGLIGRFRVEVIAVVNTNDSGPGSLRQAILDANASVGVVNTIGFAVGSGPVSFSPTTPLPAITDSVIIDGTTQPGYAGVPIVEIAGNLAPAGSIGLEVTAPSSTVRGLVLNRWGTGLALSGAGAVVQGNYIGTNAAGTAASANGVGVYIIRANGSLIGSDLDGSNDAAERNVISGNTTAGVRDGGSGALLTVAQWTTGPGANNHYYVRASVNATWAQAEQFAVLFGGHLASIGSADENAFVVANVGLGWIGLTDDPAFGGQEFGDTSGLPNRGEGWVWTDGTPAPYPVGGTLTGYQNWNPAEPNNAGGAENSAEITAGGGWNDLSTQSRAGIAEFTTAPNLPAILAALGGGSPNRIQGNYIGTNAAGTGAVANGTGLDLHGALGDTVRGNVISGNTGAGITVASAAVVGPDGHYYVASQQTYSFADAETFAVSNGGHLASIASATENALVLDSGLGWIGFTDRETYGGQEFGNTGGAANRGEGWVWTDGTPAPYPVGGPLRGYMNWNGGEPNDASNDEDFAELTGGGGWNDNDPRNGLRQGLMEFTSQPSAALLGLGVGTRTAGGLIITGNIIGRNAANTAALANGGAGISISDNAFITIGGTGAGAGNTIRDNGGAGIAVTGNATSGVTIRGNSIANNGGLGIDLGTTGLTLNDVGDTDTGPNGLQNFPVVTSATAGATTMVTGTFNGAANSAFTLDFYASAAGDPSGYGEGLRYLGSIVVNTNASGNATFNNMTITGASAAGEIISATATDSSGNTSEFALNVTAGGATGAPTVTAVNVNAGQQNTTQRSKVTSIDVVFSTQVTFSGPVAGAFQLSRIGGLAVGGFTATANVVGGVTVVTLSGFTGNETRFGSLADGRYQLTILANQVTANGQQLDGDGNGTGGDNYMLVGTTGNKFFSLFGDQNADGITNAGDFALFRTAFGTSVGNTLYVAFLDFDGDGFINAGDFNQFRIRFGLPVP